MLEVRDRATFIPVMVTILQGDNLEASYLLMRAGFNERTVFLSHISGRTRGYSDPYDWGDRTMQTAHLYIIDQIDNLKDGDVVDVQYILRETKKPKISERLGG